MTRHQSHIALHARCEAVVAERLRGELAANLSDSDVAEAQAMSTEILQNIVN